MSKLKPALDALERAVSSADEAVKKSLRKGASDAALAKLEKAAGTLGEDLEAWFRWHDGQSGATSIGPSKNDRLLSSAESLSAWRFLEREGHAPWRSQWLPVMENGAGDYVVVDRKNGKLLRYYHDDKERPSVATSLATWARDVAREWSGVAAPEPAPVDGWSRVERPKKRVLAKKPAGTAYHFRSAVPALGKGTFYTVLWKKEANAWFQATNSTLDGCWRAISNNLLPFQATPDGGVEYCLSSERAPGDVFERHFATPPFPAK
jgi:cell wall assembly regulator SMI1